MTLAQIITRAINELYNNEGTATDFITPLMVAHWVEDALMEYWGMFLDNEFGYYRFSEKTISVTSATNLYTLPNGDPTIVADTDNVAIVTAMAIRSGSSPSYVYTPIGTIPPTKKYGGVASSMRQAIYNVIGSGNGPYSWCMESGDQSVNGFPTFTIRLLPFPSSSLTLVYDGVRYPNALTYDAQTGLPDTTKIPDIPLHWHKGLILRVLREAYLRAKADTAEIEKKIDKFDKTQMQVELRSVQRQGPEFIQNTRW